MSNNFRANEYRADLIWEKGLSEKKLSLEFTFIDNGAHEKKIAFTFSDKESSISIVKESMVTITGMENVDIFMWKVNAKYKITKDTVDCLYRICDYIGSKLKTPSFVSRDEIRRSIKKAEKHPSKRIEVLKTLTVLNQTVPQNR